MLGFFVFLYHCTPTNCFCFAFASVYWWKYSINVCVRREKKQSSSSSLLCHFQRSVHITCHPIDISFLVLDFIVIIDIAIVLIQITSNLNFSDNFVYTSLFVQHVVFIFVFFILMLLGNLKTNAWNQQNISIIYWFSFRLVCVCFSSIDIFPFFFMLLTLHYIVCMCVLLDIKYAS